MLLNNIESMEAAVEFDTEFANLKARQLLERREFVKKRCPKTDDKDFNEEARIFVQAGGSFAYLLGRRTIGRIRVAGS